MVSHSVGSPVSSLELERMEDGRQRFSIGVDRGDGAELVVHMFGEMTLEVVEDKLDQPLGYRLVFTPAPASGVLGEIRIAVPDDPLEA